MTELIVTSGNFANAPTKLLRCINGSILYRGADKLFDNLWCGAIYLNCKLASLFFGYALNSFHWSCTCYTVISAAAILKPGQLRGSLFRFPVGARGFSFFPEMSLSRQWYPVNRLSNDHRGCFSFSEAAGKWWCYLVCSNAEPDESTSYPSDSFKIPF